MPSTSVSVEGGLQLHLVDGRSVFPIEASALQFAPSKHNGSSAIHHVARHPVYFKAEGNRPAGTTQLELTVVEQPVGHIESVSCACTGWMNDAGEFELDANVISDGLKISLAPVEGEL